VLPRDHPLAREAAIPLERLAELELLLPAPGTTLRAEIDSGVVPARVELRPAMELDGVRLIASLAFDGYGPAILPATAVPGHLRDRFAVVRVEGLPRRRVGVAQPRRGLPSAPARAVIDVLGLVVHDRLSMPEGIHPT
jgi:DNA-binding transcriptional LysR family regulator